MFATATDEEPVLGYRKQPSIEFPPAEVSFLPTANTCICCLYLPVPSDIQKKLPDDEELFNLYDHAFCSAYFGRQ